MKNILLCSFVLVSTLCFAQTDPDEKPVVERRNKSIVIKQEGAATQNEQPALKDLTFRQRLRLGGGISGISIGNPTTIGVSPMLGYQAANNTIVGIGGTYQYSSWKFYDQFGNPYRSSFNLLGYRAYIMQNVPFLQELVGGGFLQAELEKYENLSSNFSYRPSFLVGGGIGQQRGFNLTILYDLNYREGYNFSTGTPNSPYGSPLVIRVGGFFF